MNSAAVDDDNVKIDGCELLVARIMGNVESVEEHSTNLNYRINDGTGVIECKFWIEKDIGIKKSHR